MKTGREYIISRPELEKYFREQGGGDLFGD